MMGRGRFVFIISVCLAFISCIRSGHAWSQQNSDADVTHTPRSALQEQTTLQEVVVTATKRSEPLQNIPMSVTVLTGKMLQQAGMTDFKQYAAHVPNLSFGYSDFFAPTAQSIAIRGVQGPNTTGLYIDDTPLPENIDARAIDLARIEVLRGPQGTLYGADSMGGTVRLITNQPDVAAASAYFSDQLSNTDHGGINDLFDGMVNLPMTGTSAIRMVGYGDTISGVFNKMPLPAAPVQFTEQKGVDAAQHAGGSITGVFKFLDGKVVVTPRFITERMHANGLPYADTQPDNYSQYRLFDIQEPLNDNWNLGSLAVHWYAPIGTFSLTSSYFSRNASDLQDWSEAADYYLATSQPTPATQLDLVHETSTIDELRFTSDFAGPFQLTSGVFFQDSIKRLFTPPIVFSGTPNIFAQSLRDETGDYALYGEASYHVTSTLQLVAGARAYKTTDDTVDISSGTLSYNGTLAGRQEARGVSPKYSVEYSVSKDVKAYATAAKGFRLGGVNAFPVDLCSSSLAALGLSAQSATKYNSDSLWSYEVGLKSLVADQRVRFNVDAYRINWTNLQQLLQMDCGYNLSVNSGKARSDGGELELDALILPGLNTSLGAGYEDAVITQSTTAIPAGTPVQQVPRWTLTSDTVYNFLFSGHQFFARADFAYVGSSISTNNSIAPPFFERGAYTTLDLRLGLYIGNVELSAFCDNVQDRIGNLGDVQPLALNYPGRPQIAVTRPRTMGVDVYVSLQ